MEMNNPMMNNQTKMTIRMQEKDFESNLSFVSKIAEGANNKGQSVLFRKVENKLIMCAGGIKESVAMVAIDVQGDVGEFKGFVDAKALLNKFAGIKSGKGEVEITFDLSKFSMKISAAEGKIAMAFELIQDVVVANDAEDMIARYKNEIVERAYRIVRDVESKGKIEMNCKDFLDLGKSFPHIVYEANKRKFIDFSVYKEVQTVKKTIKNPGTDEDIEVEVSEEFPIIEGIGSSDDRMSISRKYGIGIGLPQGVDKMKLLIDTDLLKQAATAISSMKEEPVIISRGIDEMCISSGRAKFICPIKEEYTEDVRGYFDVPCSWKISVDGSKLIQKIASLITHLDENTGDRIPPENKMIIKPREKKIVFSGVDLDGYDVESEIDYSMAMNENGIEYRDFDVDEVPLTLHRKYIKEFLGSCSCKGKKISFGAYTYQAKRKKMENRMFVKDENGNYIEEVYQGRLISIEDANQGVYGVHHRIKI